MRDYLAIALGAFVLGAAVATLIYEPDSKPQHLVCQRQTDTPEVRWAFVSHLGASHGFLILNRNTYYKPQDATS